MTTPLPERHFQVRFMRGIRGTDPILDEPIPQIAFLGRSNVGKSSTINALLKVKIAKTSARPGKTTEINVYDVNDGANSYRVMDLPGYGFSRTHTKGRDKLRKLVIWYLTASGTKPHIVLIVDSMVPPTEFDSEAYALTRELGLPLTILANKADRLNQRERANATRVLGEAYPEASIALISAEKGEGIADLREELFPRPKKKR